MARSGRHSNERDLLAQLQHRYGADRVAPGSSESGAFVAVQAIGGAVTFGSGCSAIKGDAPNQGDTLPEGERLFLPFDTVVVDGGSAGALFAFHADNK